MVIMRNKPTILKIALRKNEESQTTEERTSIFHFAI